MPRSLASAFSGGLGALIVWRFMTGLGLGGAMPMTITLASEFCPAARRSSLVTLMFCGFTLGSAMGGFIAARVLPEFGWRVLLLGGGVAPLAARPGARGADARIRALPRHERRRGRPHRRGRSGASHPRRIFDGARFVDTAIATASPVAQLFRGGLLTGTLLLWLAFFMSLLVVYLMTNWMPTLLQQASGASLADAARDRGDVPGRRHTRGDSRRAADGQVRTARRARSPAT